MKSNANGLMGDLESIKALLEEDDEPTSWDIAAEPVQELSVETSATNTPATSATSTTSATAASLDALLGTDFHDATATVMARARGLIEQHPNRWSPQQTDELSDALRVRIDGAVQEWITASLTAHAGELQQRLLNAVRDELARHLEAFETNADSEPS